MALLFWASLSLISLWCFLVSWAPYLWSSSQKPHIGIVLQLWEGKERKKKHQPLRGEERLSSSEFCLLHFSVPAAFCCHCGMVSGLGSERMKKREGVGNPRDFFTLGAFGVPFPTPSSELNSFSFIYQHQQCSFFGFTLNWVQARSYQRGKETQQTRCHFTGTLNSDVFFLLLFLIVAFQRPQSNSCPMHSD